MVERYKEKSDEFRELAVLLEKGVEALSAAVALLAEFSPDEYAIRSQALPHDLERLTSISSRALRYGNDEDYRAWSRAQEACVSVMPRIGRNGAAMLLRLLREPGVDISTAELSHAAGIRSPGVKAVKVYICHLRRALQERHFPADAIETGRCSYRLSVAAAPGIRKMLDM
ncbi:hypothetical protein ACFX59_17895 [Sphingomonas sp. NCPPB 2930]|uniref:hypothetical protein n=1 Tax=Sphingomonas sp. NCPPB 2930 TaxID=3162788 RepID=UPI0036D84672